jgi:hypothetical protein
MSSPVISGSVQEWKKRKKFRSIIKRNNVLLTRVFSKYATWLQKASGPAWKVGAEAYRGETKQLTG